MDEQFSSLLDDELDSTARDRAYARLIAEPELRNAWTRQHLLRAVLAGEDRCLPDANFADRVMAAACEGYEAPAASAAKVVPLRKTHGKARSVKPWAMGGLAMAASIIGVMIVLRVMPVETPNEQITVAAKQQPAVAASTQKVTSDAHFQREMEEYLLEHQRLANRHGLAAPRGYMRVATPGFTQVSYSGE
ncbi:MAG: sigma-E factor negative regulatory protein [Salinisphaeraceae bacterium]|nr:sigma-E factor negative regulatory protein [Salinisphaeraceae bacterium]